MLYPSKPPSRPVHPLTIRLAHWVGAYAMICMILSGWQIYNASPILPFLISTHVTLGGWLGGALAWHFAAMWLLMGSGLVYLIYGFASGHFRRDFLPIGPGAVLRDARLALAFRLKHELGVYNAVQRLLYLLVILGSVAIVATGLSIWKPVQLSWLTALFGGYDVARRLHFALMVAIVLFLAIHVSLVAIVPSTLLAMIAGGRRQTAVPDDGLEAGQ